MLNISKVYTTDRSWHHEILIMLRVGERVAFFSLDYVQLRFFFFNPSFSVSTSFLFEMVSKRQYIFSSLCLKLKMFIFETFLL